MNGRDAFGRKEKADRTRLIDQLDLYFTSISCTFQMLMKAVMDKVSAVIPAAGQGVRFGSNIPKQFLVVKGKPLLFWTLKALSDGNAIDECAVVLPVLDFDEYKRVVIPWFTELKGFGTIRIVMGGKERQESVWKGLQSLCGGGALVLIHDGARPVVSEDLLSRVIGKALETGAAIAALPARDTIKRGGCLKKKDDPGGGPVVWETLDRSAVWLAQTPQVFRKDLILEAYQKAMESCFMGTDDASLVEKLGYPVSLVEGDPRNIKITTQEDMEWFEWHLTNNIRP